MYEKRVYIILIVIAIVVFVGSLGVSKGWYPLHSYMTLISICIILLVLFSELISFILKKKEINISPLRDPSINLFNQPKRPTGATLRKKDVINEIIENKKKKFTKIPHIIFHYADKEQIENIYNDYFNEAKVESVVSEIVKDVKGELSASIPKLIGSKAAGQDFSKYISTLKMPDISLSEMFRRWQLKTIENSEVTLGIEEVDIDLSELRIFNNLIRKLTYDFNLKIDSSKIDDVRASLKQKAAEKTFKRLENVTDFVLIEGKFEIKQKPKQVVELVYNHPVNDYLNENSEMVSIKVILEKSFLEPTISPHYNQLNSKSISLNVFGKVLTQVDRNANSWEIQILPLAIY